MLVCLPCAANGLPELPDLPPPGSTLQSLDRSGYRCGESNHGFQCRRAGQLNDRVAGEPVLEIVLVYRQGRLARPVMTIDEQHFRALAKRLSVSLGTASEGDEALNAGMGGTFKNAYFVWKQNGHTWLLEQFFERVIHSGLWILADEEFDLLMSERERSSVRGVRNL